MAARQQRTGLHQRAAHCYGLGVADDLQSLMVYTSTQTLHPRALCVHRQPAAVLRRVVPCELIHCILCEEFRGFAGRLGAMIAVPIRLDPKGVYGERPRWREQNGRM